MPFRTIPESNTRYALISFDAQGQERRDDPDGLMSARILELAKSGEYTNIFWFGHGWKGDVPEAIRQYDLWIKAFDTLRSDREIAERTFPGFRPLYIGLHWPSRSWGNEELEGTSFSVGDTASPEEMEKEYLDELGDTPAAREAVRIILDEARTGAALDTLTSRAKEAFLALDAELGLAGSPDTDGMAFDPDALAAGGEEASYGSMGNGILGILRQLTYWKMKKRAREIGENALHPFLIQLQRATAERRTAIHLMGHSFGCILISSTIGGPGAAAPLDRPVDSVALVQGAVSLWSYAAKSFHDGPPGYFHSIVTGQKVRGPLITTQSQHDDAVDLPYRLASQVSGDVSFGALEYPEYGAIGRFGLQGLEKSLCVDTRMLPASENYGFECSKIYNLEASKFICKKKGLSGAHSDIGGPEVAHAIWEAALASRVS